MSILGELGAFAAGASIGSQGATLRDVQRRHFVDALAAMIAGRATGDASALAGVLADRPLGRRVAEARLSEADDIHCASCVTPSAVVAPAAVTAIEREPDADPARLADALWVGTEAMTRLGAAIDGARILYRGIWPTCFCAPFGVAATLGRLTGLDAESMTDALAISLYLASGAVSRGDRGRTPRWLLIALAAEQGAHAAGAARAGFGGDAGLLDSPGWLADARGIALDAGRLTAGLGETCIYGELSLKPFCAAKQAIAATDAVRDLLAGGLDPSAVESVEIRVPPPYAAMISRQAVPGDRTSTLVSAAHQIALASLRPDAMYDVKRADLPFDGEIAALAGRIAVRGDDSPGLTAHFPARFPARVAVAAAGRTYERRVVEATGDPGRPLDDAALRSKTARILANAGRGGEADTLFEIAGAALSDAVAARALPAALARISGPAPSPSRGGKPSATGR